MLATRCDLAFQPLSASMPQTNTHCSCGGGRGGSHKGGASFLNGQPAKNTQHITVRAASPPCLRHRVRCQQTAFSHQVLGEKKEKRTKNSPDQYLPSSLASSGEESTLVRVNATWLSCYGLDMLQSHGRFFIFLIHH